MVSTIPTPPDPRGGERVRGAAAGAAAAEGARGRAAAPGYVAATTSGSGRVGGAAARGARGHTAARRRHCVLRPVLSAELLVAAHARGAARCPPRFGPAPLCATTIVRRMSE